MEYTKNRITPETEILECTLALVYYVSDFNIIGAVFLIGD